MTVMAIVEFRREGSVPVAVELHDADPDLSVVDALARLQLMAERFGYSLRVRGASAELLELLELAGLRDVIRAAELER